MNFLSKEISSEERSAKRFRLGLFLSAFLIPTAGVYYKYKVQIDDLFKKTSDIKNNAVYYKKGDMPKLNLKDIKKETQPFSYQASETDPAIMGDPNKIKEYQQSEFKKYRVQKGDDAQGIAHAFGISIPQLKKANPKVDWGNLKQGQKLNITLIAGGPAGATTDYSEKIPQAYPDKKVNTSTKTAKTKKMKTSSKKSTQTAKLQKEKEKTEEKKETLQAIIEQKNSEQAKTNPKENQKKISQTINKSNLSDKEKKVAKQMAKEKDDKALKEAKALLEKKETVIDQAISTNNPLYYYQWPREIFDFTYSKEQRENAYAYYLLTAVNSGVWNDGPYRYKIHETTNFQNQTWAIIYFLAYRSGNLFSNGFYFPFNGKKITNETLFLALKKLRETRDSVAHTSTAADTAYKNHWHEWEARFGGETSSQSSTVPK